MIIIVIAVVDVWGFLPGNVLADETKGLCASHRFKNLFPSRVQGLDLRLDKGDLAGVNFGEPKGRNEYYDHPGDLCKDSSRSRWLAKTSHAYPPRNVVNYSASIHTAQHFGGQALST